MGVHGLVVVVMLLSPVEATVSLETATTPKESGNIPVDCVPARVGDGGEIPA